jgi:hypothetical protein
VFATAVCLLLDVAIRRIVIQPDRVWLKSVALWQRLRGQAITEETPEYIERLRSRKAKVSESMDKQKAGTKFDAGAFTPSSEAPPIAGAAAEPAKPVPAKSAAPRKEEDAADFASRLMRAKKKAMEDRDKDKDKK